MQIIKKLWQRWKQRNMLEHERLWLEMRKKNSVSKIDLVHPKQEEKKVEHGYAILGGCDNYIIGNGLDNIIGKQK